MGAVLHLPPVGSRRRRRPSAVRRLAGTALYWLLLVLGAAAAAALLVSQPADDAIRGGAVLLAPVGIWLAHRFEGVGQALGDLRYAPLAGLRAGAWGLPLASAVITLIATVAIELFARAALYAATVLGQLL